MAIENDQDAMLRKQEAFFNRQQQFLHRSLEITEGTKNTMEAKRREYDVFNEALKLAQVK